MHASLRQDTGKVLRCYSNILPSSLWPVGIPCRIFVQDDSRLLLHSRRPGWRGPTRQHEGTSGLIRTRTFNMTIYLTYRTSYIDSSRPRPCTRIAVFML